MLREFLKLHGSQSSRRGGGWGYWNMRLARGVDLRLCYACVPILRTACRLCRVWLGKPFLQKANSKYLRSGGLTVSVAGIQFCCCGETAATDKR